MIDGTAGTLRGRAPQPQQELCSPIQGSGVFQTQSVAGGSLSWLLITALSCRGDRQARPAWSPSACRGWEPAETLVVCSRMPQALLLLKRQWFELVGRPVSPYSPAWLLAAPWLPLSIPGRHLVQRQWRRLQLEDFSPGSATPVPAERAGDAEICRDALGCPCCI